MIKNIKKIQRDIKSKKATKVLVLFSPKFLKKTKGNGALRHRKK